ncbi:MAG: hypothetical protein NTV01_08455 [Bacteroidia bacterium]|nr:hypothetical protein [Bacteroidia bacterium]
MEFKDIITEMPCRPDELNIPWSFIGTLGSYEKEVAAAILLRYSHDAGRWVGVSAIGLDERIS